VISYQWRGDFASAQVEALHAMAPTPSGACSPEPQRPSPPTPWCASASPQN